MVKKGPVFSMFHQKSRGVSLILFSDGVPEMESVEKPNYARHGHGASILNLMQKGEIRNIVLLVGSSVHFFRVIKST